MGSVSQDRHFGLNLGQCNHRHVSEHIRDPQRLRDVVLVVPATGQLQHQARRQLGRVIQRMLGARMECRSKAFAPALFSAAAVFNWKNAEQSLRQQALQLLQAVHHTHLLQREMGFTAIERDRSRIVTLPLGMLALRV